MKLFDLHCDTATRLYTEHQSLTENSLHISLSAARSLESYAQVMAVWTDARLSDASGYERFFDVVKNLRREVAQASELVALVEDADGLCEALASGKTAMILSVEDARILEGDLSRLDVLRTEGVRTLTLNWSGVTCIGGAHDTDVGLSDFGRAVVDRCFDIGIVPDVSHCSHRGTVEVIALARERSMPIIASHSDSYTQNPHTRNLRDEDLSAIRELHGLVGINLCPTHLRNGGDASLCDVIRHIEHYLSLGCEDIIAMGCDLDGTSLPHGFSGLSDIPSIVEELARLNYTDTLIERITYRNALDFFKRSL